MGGLRRLLVTMATTVALAGATGAWAPSAEAAEKPATVTTYVASDWTAPKKGQTTAGVRALQQRLVKAGRLDRDLVTSYYGDKTAAAVKAFQRRAGLSANGKVSRTTWTRLVAATGRTKVTDVQPRLDARCRVEGRVICVDKTRRTAFYVVDSEIVRMVDARFGCAGMRTREGTFSVRRKSRDHVSSIYHTPMPLAMFFSGGQAVHYSADFAARGYAGCSHGCVNVRDRATLAWVFDQVRVGDRVVVYRS